MTVAERNAARGATVDDLFANVSLRVPSFGGMYYDADGSERLVINTTDASQNDAALAAVRSVFRSVDALNTGVRFKLVRYSFRQLAAWRDRVMAEDAFKNVMQYDVGEVSGQLAYGVENDLALTDLRMALSEPGVPVEAARIEVVRRLTPATLTLDSIFRPIKAGVSFAGALLTPGTTYSYGDCSLGQLATMAGTRYIITASHCTDGGNGSYSGVNGVKFYQPYPDTFAADTNLVGVEVSDPGFAAGLSGCPVNALCRYADAALLQVPSTVSSNVGDIAETSGRSNTMGVSGSTTVTGTLLTKASTSDTALLRNRLIHKIGRRTGWTWGTISATCRASRVLPNDPTTGKERYRLCDYEATTYAGRGDSGRPVFTWWTTGTNPQQYWADYLGVVSQIAYWSGDFTGQTGYLVFSTLGGIRGDLGAGLVVHQ